MPLLSEGLALNAANANFAGKAVWTCHSRSRYHRGDNAVKTSTMETIQGAHLPCQYAIGVTKPSVERGEHTSMKLRPCSSMVFTIEFTQHLAHKETGRKFPHWRRV